MAAVVREHSAVEAMQGEVRDRPVAAAGITAEEALPVEQTAMLVAEEDHRGLEP
jgi:hypothetical protein